MNGHALVGLEVVFDTHRCNTCDDSLGLSRSIPAWGRRDRRRGPTNLTIGLNECCFDERMLRKETFKQW